MMKQSDQILELLKSDIQMIEKVFESLSFSINRCRQITSSPEFTNEELEYWEALSSRFARTSDLYVKRIIKTILLFLAEPAGSFIDQMNKCEKFGIIASTEKMVEIRRLRNEIAHEYKYSDLTDLFTEILDGSGQLVVNYQQTKAYLKENSPLFGDIISEKN